jgi:hypothetical protein
MQSRLEAAQRSEDVAIATKGYDSAAANRAADIVARREKARDKANNAHWNAQMQLEADKANLQGESEAQRIGATLSTHGAENQQLFKIADIIKQDAANQGIKMTNTEALNQASQIKSPYNVSKQNASEFSNAQDNYNSFYINFKKENPDIEPPSFDEFLKQRYTSAQIQSMTNGQQIGSGSANDLQSQLRELAIKRGLIK